MNSLLRDRSLETHHKHYLTLQTYDGYLKLLGSIRHFCPLKLKPLDHDVRRTLRLILYPLLTQHGNIQENKTHGLTFLLFLSSLDRKSTRLNSSHVAISYAVFCLKK